MSRNRSNFVWVLPLVLLAVYLPLAVTIGVLQMPPSAAIHALKLTPASSAAQTLAQTAYLIVFAGVGIVAFVRLGALAAAIFLAAAVGVDMAASRYLSAEAGSNAAAIGLCLVWGGAGLGQLLAIRQDRVRLRTLFAGRLSKTAIREILRYPDMVRLDSETRTLSGLSCRLIVPENMMSGEAQGQTETTSHALKALTKAAIENGAAIDAISACGFTAFWNAPLNDPDHALHACTAAVAMHKALASVNKDLSARYGADKTAFSPLQIALGIATGPAAVGRIETDRPTYSAGGLMLEIAVRLQQIAARYGAFALVGEATQSAAAADFAFLEVDYRIMEPNGPVRLFALQGTSQRTSPRFRAQATFHTHLFAAIRSQNWKKARDLLERCRALSGANAQLYDLHLARIAFYERNPPGENWDGAYRPPMH